MQKKNGNTKLMLYVGINEMYMELKKGQKKINNEL